MFVPNCEFHYPLSATERVRLLMEPGTFKQLDAGMTAVNPMEFEGYPERLEKARRRTELDDAILSGVGEIGDKTVAFAAMDFGFIGGSMGSVVGERVARTMEFAYSEELPLIIVSASGGPGCSRESTPLMQLAKTSVALSRYMYGSWPYISILADPTFGGVTASFATAADVILAEPGARIGFAGAPGHRRHHQGAPFPRAFRRRNFSRNTEWWTG